MTYEKKVTLANNIIMSVIFAVVFTLLGQYAGTGSIELSSALLPWLFGLILGFCVIQFIPVVQWGAAAAVKLKAKPGSLFFHTIVAFVISAVFVIVMSISMTIFTMSVLGDAPVQTALLNAFKSMPLFFSVSWLLSIIISEPCLKLARKIVKYPAGDEQTD